MRSKYLFLFMALIMAAFLAVSCAGSDDENPDGDVTDGDVSDVETDDVTDGDTEPTEEDVDEGNGCTCDTQDDCCNGCKPINEEGTCDDSDLCTTVDVCRAGICTGTEPVDCSAGAEGCATGTGTCNSATGRCEFDSALPNGSECEAVSGQPGSGMCFDGQCMSFGTCDNRSYNQEINHPCNYDSECASGYCMEFGNGWAKLCSQECGTDNPCPEGTECTDKGGTMGFWCQPVDADGILPGDASLSMFQVCNANEDCQEGLCLGIGEFKFCSGSCTNPETGYRDTTMCGDCGYCRKDGDEQGFPWSNYCIPQGSAEVGEPCGSSFDCKDRYCFDNYCSEQCWTITDEIDTCPDAMTCVPGIVDPEVGICIYDDSVGFPMGSACDENYQCETGYCADAGEEKLCGYDCTVDECPEGECVETGEHYISTKIYLYNDGETEHVEYGYSSMYHYIDTPGTYTFQVKVAGQYESSAGYYALTIKQRDDETTPAAALETEPNDTQETAQGLGAIPVQVTATLATADDVDFYEFTVEVGELAEGETYTLDFAINRVMMKMCVPEEQVGSQGWGESCEDDFECADGAVCYRGYCTAACTTSDDCTDGECFEYGDDELYCVPESIVGSEIDGRDCDYSYECRGECYDDEYLRDVYCTGECQDDTECVAGMQCYGGICVKHSSEMIYPYGNCRIDLDCESGMCISGRCTDTCTDAADCEGGELIEPVEFGMCWPCSANADCNDGGADGPNICLSNGVESFCAFDCTDDDSVCPSGTRCYALDYFQSACAPVTFSCGVAAGCTEDGLCLRPTQSDLMACGDNAECQSGVCENDLCQAGECTVDEDCGCGMLTCVDSYCAITLGDEIAELEPNDVIADAQELNTFPARVVASIMPHADAVDVDIFKISMTAGQVLDARTDAFCNLMADTYLRFLDAQGNPIEGMANDDISANGGNYLSILLGYKAETDQDVYVEVTQSPQLNGMMSIGYMLEVNVFTPEANDTCAAAVEVTDGTYDFDMLNATNDYTAQSCTGYAAIGKDLAYTVTVPSNYILEATVSGAMDMALYLVSDCTDTNAACLVGSDRNGANAAENIVYANESGSDETLYLIVDSWLPVADMSFTLQVALDEIVTPDNNTGATAIHVAGGDVVQGTTYGATDDYDPGAEGCTGAATPGQDVVYSLTMYPGRYMRAAVSALWSVQLYLVTDYNDLTTCVAAGTGALNYQMNPSPTKDDSVTLYLIVDSADITIKGNFTLTMTIENVGECAGVCDAATYARHCTDASMTGTDLCTCDSTGLLAPIDCNAYCVGEGTLSGLCADDVPTSSGFNSYCVCDYSCDDVVQQCQGGAYTNCTCAAADPCGWSGDGYCDAYCPAVYPESSIDESSDCATE